MTDNDFVIEMYKHYKRLHPEDEINIIKPFRINLNLFTLFKKEHEFNRLRALRSYEVEGMRVHLYPFLSAWRLRNMHALLARSAYYLNYRRLKSLLGEKSFDVIHAQFILPDGILARQICRRWGIPFVITTHHERFYFEHWLSRKIALNVLRSASSVLPINNFNFSYFQSIGIRNLTFSPLGFDHRFLRPQKETGSGIVYILTVAELIKLKNIDNVIRAVKELVKTYKIKYTIIGQGPERTYLEQLTKQQGLEEHVVFRGAVPYDQIHKEMYQHDIFIMPSYFETFGRVYFEVMAMGIPIICAKNSGIFGIFKEDYEGISVDHNSIEQITLALSSLISDEQKRAEIGLNGQNLVKKYTWGNVVKALENKYTEAACNSTFG
jgi:glycosyltransferase involved in cell wall biosynthesis